MTAKIKSKKKEIKAQKKVKKNIQYSSFQILEAKYKTLLTNKFKNRKAYVPCDISKLTAAIPGTILTIDKTKGMEVKKGERILVLEAMKIKNQILSPVDATIKKVHVSETNVVFKNQLLVEFEKIS